MSVRLRSYKEANINVYRWILVALAFFMAASYFPLTGALPYGADSFLQRCILGGLILLTIFLEYFKVIRTELAFPFCYFISGVFLVWSYFVFAFNDFHIYYMVAAFIAYCITIGSVVTGKGMMLGMIIISMVSVLLIGIGYFKPEYPHNIVEVHSFVMGLLIAMGVFGMVFYHSLSHRLDVHEKIEEINDRLRQEVAERTQQLEAKNKELLRSNEELERFAYIASHDLKEPLRMVGSYVQIIKYKYDKLLDDEGREFIGFAVDGVKRMNSLIEDLLQISRLASDEHFLDIKPVSSELLVRLIQRNLSIACEERNATIEFDDLPTVTYNKLHLQMVLQNLIENAVKFSDPERPNSIRVSCRENPAQWLFKVEDSGIGIKEEYKDKIFTIFQRLHTRQDYEGNGIGLAICKKIIEKYGGKIGFKSEPGVGTTFFFTIPKEIKILETVQIGKSKEPEPIS